MPQNYDLFEDSPEIKALTKTEAKIHGSRLSKNQKRFNELVSRVNKLKNEYVEWQTTGDRLRTLVSQKYEPLLKTYDEQRISLVRIFDKQFNDKRFKKTDHKKLRHIICEVAMQYANSEYGDEMKRLYDKYSERSFDEVNEEASEFAKSFLNEMYDFDLPDDLDLNDEEQVREFFKRQDAEEEASRNFHQESSKPRKKTAKQLQKEKQQQLDEQNIRKSLQAIFRKLAATLHPDREADPQERERKTELMQQVNIAYEKNDLLRLLELQLEIEQIGQQDIQQINDERLRSYIKILKEQCDDLEQDILDIQMPFRMQFDIPVYARVTPHDVVRGLEMDIANLRRDVNDLKKQLEHFRDPLILKAWLKIFKIPKREEIDAPDFLY